MRLWRSPACPLSSPMARRDQGVGRLTLRWFYAIMLYGAKRHYRAKTETGFL